MILDLKISELVRPRPLVMTPGGSAFCFSHFLASTAACGAALPGDLPRVPPTAFLIQIHGLVGP